MKLCPNCKGIATYDPYFGTYNCSNCNWVDDTPNKERIAKRKILNCNSIEVYKLLEKMLKKENEDKQEELVGV